MFETKTPEIHRPALPSGEDTTDLIGAFLSDLNEHVQGPHRPIDVEGMGERVRQSVQRTIDASAGLMLRNPWRIVAAVYPFLPLTWPVEDKSLVDVLCECRRQLAEERAVALGQPADNPFDYRARDLTALRAAEQALTTMIAADGAGREAVARAVA